MHMGQHILARVKLVIEPSRLKKKKVPSDSARDLRGGLAVDDADAIATKAAVPKHDL
jgi:hypothetical protein